MIFHCAVAVIDGRATRSVRLHTDPNGRIARLERGVEAGAGDVRLGTVTAGMANAHSHAFHRALRGRTNADGGDFWRWREAMYVAAAALDPELYRALAAGVFAEMLASGYTSVGEFHYLHHRADGGAYEPAHAMELALADAAEEVGIRLTLLDTCYLAGGIGQQLTAAQRRFGDGSAAGWLRRWESLSAALEGRPLVTLGAALHSVRAVPRQAMAEILAALPENVPVHVHLSEQQQENDDCLREYGVTPTGLLAGLGALAPRLSVVHATHLTADDTALLGAARVTVVMCPSTEADLGDGIGPARALADAGAVIALGSDQNAVIDPLLEARGLEAGERLFSRRRGRFAPAELSAALTSGGQRALGAAGGGISVGAACDLVELDTGSVRTVGSLPEQLPLVATAADVRRVIVGGAVVAENGRLVGPRGHGIDPADLLVAPLATLHDRIARRENA